MGYVLYGYDGTIDSDMSYEQDADTPDSEKEGCPIRDGGAVGCRSCAISGRGW